jgi:hypothetical protein
MTRLTSLAVLPVSSSDRATVFSVATTRVEGGSKCAIT